MFARNALNTVSKKAVASRMMAVRFNSGSAGATGGVRSTGGSDNFTKRERAQEDYYIKKHQEEEIQALREQLAQQKKRLDKLESESKSDKE